MLNTYYSNKIEWLVELLSKKLQTNPPEVFEKIDISNKNVYIYDWRLEVCSKYKEPIAGPDGVAGGYGHISSDTIYYLQNKYKNDRANEYLSIGDQLDLLYKDIIAGTLDANGGFAKAVKKVKDNNPK